MTDANTPGPLTQSELLNLWKTVVDPRFAQPLIEQGEGYGLEAHTQLQSQLARISQAIDVTMQSMYINAWSGQTNPPASGEAKATVTLTISRTGLLTFPLVLKAGQFVVEESTTDYGDNGPVTVLTGRKYIIQSDVSFGVSDAGPKTVVAEAQYVGVGFNNPLPNTITAPYQPGTGFFNNRGTVTLSTSPTLIVDNQPDVVIPEHVGQYVMFTSGSNSGIVKQIVSYSGPQPDLFPPNGGSVVLDSATALIAESFTASWRILDWVNDWGLTVAHTLSPSGGKLGLLDALGEERKIRRAPNETDPSYRRRISQIADVVSPNAIIRAANRVLSQLGLSCTLREVGQINLRGFFFDGDPFNSDPEHAFAYDMGSTHYGEADVIRDKYKWIMDFAEFRAFFLIGVPKVSIGEFGYAYDSGLNDAYDAAPFNAYWDGYALGTANLYKQVWQAVDKVHAGGVGFDLNLEP